MTDFKNRLVKELEVEIPARLIGFLPAGYKRVGHIGILNLKSELSSYSKTICQCALRNSTNVRSFAVSSPVRGNYRKPGIKILAGDPSTLTVHRENKCLFKLDAAEIMFSAGNHYERERLASITGPVEKVLDMFCCIGNLSILVAVMHPGVEITGVEINPVAFRFLEETIELNGVGDRFRAISGDNREVILPPDHFDRVIMGYFTVDDNQLEVALRSLKQNGGTLHIHDVPGWRQLSLENHLEKILQSGSDSDHSLRVSSFTTRRVKWIAEKTAHVVHDVVFTQVNP